MINQQLIDYIRSQMTNRVNPDLIKQELVKNGWSSVDIESAFSQIQNTNVQSNSSEAPPVENTGSVSTPQQTPFTLNPQENNDPDSVINQPHYEAMIPLEQEPKTKGITEGALSIVSAVISLIFILPIFGISGIVLGIIARKKGRKALGVTGIILSAIFMVVGLVIRYFVLYQ